MPKRECPYCKEKVNSNATICKHCKSDLPPLPPKPPKKWYQTWWGFLIILFALSIVARPFLDHSPSTSSQSDSASEKLIIPYDSLTLDSVKDPKILDFMGWGMGKQIHGKYGVQSQQQALIDYTKILNHKKESVDRYLGKPLSHNNRNEYTYKASYGSIKVGYMKGVSHNLTVDYVIKFNSYIDTLKAVGIDTIKRPFAVNNTR